MILRSTVSACRHRAGMTLRQLAVRAHTSHATLSAYEHGRSVPTIDTLERVAAASGFIVDVHLVPAVGGADRAARGRELADVLELAAQFPARYETTLQAPVFGR
ncbi:MAG: helix-turn-helix domain-containing protein [Actinomycetota bacterium]|jgi:transcriptional regulator with XRE-family HTH domain|nr:helix-turn-helix domain-containing protein [Actinomycetota bacterium]